MTTKIATIHGGRLPGEPEPELIAMLEELLKEAKAGNLVAFGYATVKDDGAVGSGWEAGSGTRNALSVAVSILNLRYVQALLDDDHG